MRRAGPSLGRSRHFLASAICLAPCEGAISVVPDERSGLCWFVVFSIGFHAHHCEIAPRSLQRISFEREVDRGHPHRGLELCISLDAFESVLPRRVLVLHGHIRPVEDELEIHKCRSCYRIHVWPARPLLAPPATRFLVQPRHFDLENPPALVPQGVRRWGQYRRESPRAEFCRQPRRRISSAKAWRAESLPSLSRQRSSDSDIGQQTLRQTVPLL